MKKCHSAEKDPTPEPNPSATTEMVAEEVCKDGRQETRIRVASGGATNGRKYKYQTEEYAVRRCHVDAILKAFNVKEDEMIDGFSTVENKRFKVHYTKDSSGPWTSTMWLNPPWSMWPSVACRVLAERCACICVCPFWGTRWLQQLMMSAASSLYYPRGEKLCELNGVQCGGIKWSVLAIYIPSREKIDVVPLAIGKTSAARRRWRRKPTAATQSQAAHNGGTLWGGAPPGP